MIIPGKIHAYKQKNVFIIFPEKSQSPRKYGTSARFNRISDGEGGGGGGAPCTVRDNVNKGQGYPSVG